MLHKTIMTLEQREKAVKEYLKGGQSLRKIAQSFGVSYKTLWFWVKLYTSSGKENFRRHILRKVISDDIEKKVFLLKEHFPSLTVSAARKMLNKSGISISNKGIWSIWKRYGFAGNREQRKQQPFSLFISSTSKLEKVINNAKYFVEKKDYRSAAKVLNELPRLPECQLLLEIPAKLLTPRRRLERLYLEYNFENKPLPQLFEKVRKIGNILEKEGLVYSSIMANFIELNLLDWMGKSKEKMPIFHRLATKMKGMKNSNLLFFLNYERAMMYCDSYQIQKALNSIKECCKIARRLAYPIYWDFLGGFFTFVADNRRTLRYYEEALEKEKKGELRNLYAIKLAFGYCMSGEYAKARQILNSNGIGEANRNFRSSLYSFSNASISFGTGNLTGAKEFFQEMLKNATKSELLGGIYSASVGLSAIAIALGYRAIAEEYLTKNLFLTKKHKQTRHSLILSCFLGLQTKIPKRFMQLSDMFLLNLIMQANRTLKIGDYRMAYEYARKKKILGLFHRWILFFPDIVQSMLEKGKPTGLPKVILELPVFNKEITVYHIKFLGNLIVFKNQKYLKAELRPKDAAFLIYLCNKAMEPKESINLEEVYANLWPKSEDASRNFSHLLVRIKKALKIPTHLLTVSRKYGIASLINGGIYFTTDYQEFEQAIATAHALERAEEWSFARKEYLRAFRLFRGEPFKKMYDNWSENIRRVILNKLETEVVHFASGCLGHGNKTDARRILEKVLKIIPNSEKSQKILETL